MDVSWSLETMESRKRNMTDQEGSAVKKIKLECSADNLQVALMPVNADKLQAALMPVLVKLFECEPIVGPFKAPVDPVFWDCPDYYKIIKNPMDLGTIKVKLVSGQYSCPWEFIQDVYLVFENAQVYNNKSHCVHKWSLELTKVFETEITPIMKSMGYCCGIKRFYLPQTLRCSGENCNIYQNAAIYFHEDSGLVLCQECFKKSKKNVLVKLGDRNINVGKTAFTKRTNNMRESEQFVYCEKCDKPWHEICALFFEPVDKRFNCVNCVKETTGKSKMKDFTAKRLPKTRLGSYLERKVNKFLKEEDMGSGKVTIRVLYNNDKSVAVKPFTQERRVYISYLDSVQFFQPPQLRTAVYHEILIRYLKYVKKLGFAMAHIWVCPPSNGEEYIFNCHPPDQKIPSLKHLACWYKSMLEKAKNKKVVLSYKGIVDNTVRWKTLDEVKKLPLFDGDFWPNLLEGIFQKATVAEPRKRKKNVSLEIFKKLCAFREESIVVQLHAAHVIEDLGPISDPDPPIKNDLMDTHDNFLVFALENHYEFSSLRRAKLSSIAFLYELHNPGKEEFVCNCCEASVEAYYHCTVCEDFDLCVRCFEEQGHEHRMDRLGFYGDAYLDKQEHPTESHHGSVQQDIESSQSTCQCTDANCCTHDCRSLQGAVKVVLKTQKIVQIQAAQSSQPQAATMPDMTPSIGKPSVASMQLLVGTGSKPGVVVTVGGSSKQAVAPNHETVHTQGHSPPPMSINMDMRQQPQPPHPGVSQHSHFAATLNPAAHHPDAAQTHLPGVAQHPGGLSSHHSSQLQPSGSQLHSSQLKPNGSPPHSSQPQPSGSQLHSSQLQPNGSQPHCSQPQPSGSQLHSSQPQASGSQPHSSQLQPNGSPPHSSQPQPSGSQPHSSQPQASGSQPHSSQPQPSGSQLHSSQPQPSGSQLHSSQRHPQYVPNASVSWDQQRKF